MSDATKVGIIGCGNISGRYMEAGQVFRAFDVVACADLDATRARATADEYGVRACTPDELLSDKAIEIVINLTIPAAHAEVAMAAVEAGKHVYNEKPLTSAREEARALLAAADARGLRVGCAPDTFMGGGLQTCCKLIDDGAIGRPVSAIGFIMFHGHEHWHPSPEFLYQRGGGPMFDMGVYHVQAFVAMLGAVRRVTGATGTAFEERVITSEPKRGQKIKVEVPTHVAGLMDFESGAVGTLITSFDTYAAEIPRFQVFGTEGTITGPDPNSFGGPVRLWRAETREWEDVPLTHGYAEQSRGLGVADMANAIRSGRPHRASGRLAFHTLDIMHAFHDASDRGCHVELTTGCERPVPLPIGLEHGAVDP